MAKEFKLPDVGEGVESGTVVSVLVKAGDIVAVDQSVIELETDKAVVEVPSTVAGTVTEVAVSAGAEVKVGQLVMTVEEGAAAPGEPVVEAPVPEAPAAEAPVEKEVPQPAPATAPAAAAPAGRTIPAAPSVRRIARERGIDLSQVQGSGILGRISLADLDRAGQAAPAATSVPAFKLPDFSRWGSTTRQPMSGVRKATVRSMATAWATVPMVTHFDKADSTEMEAMRKRYQPRAEAAGTKLTPTAILVKVAAAALRKFPDFNASIDVETQEIIYKDYVNITVAVDTPAGLLVPVIRDADKKNVIELSKDLGELAAKARDRKLSMEDMQGGNFSISNLGGIGGTGFTPIVSPPEVAILGVSRSAMEPVYDKASGEFRPRLMMPLSLTYDHRLIDGASAARFLRWICEAVEEPFLMSLEG